MPDLINAIPRSLLLPPASLLVLTMLGLLLWRRWPRMGKVMAGSGLVALAFLSTGAGAGFLVRPLERQTAPLLAPEKAGAQAIVVLAAGRMRRAPEYGDRDIPDYIALARVRYAAHLQRRTKLPVLVSGGNGPGNDTYTKADAMATALREDFGVPVKWVEGKSRDTGENAAFSAKLLGDAGVTKILLVTDAMHMARARAAFERTGLQVVDAPTMFFGDQAHGPAAWMPTGEGMRRSWHAAYELLGGAWYRLRAAKS